MVITDRYEWDLIDWLHVLYHINIHDDTRTRPSFQVESVTIVQENNIKAFKKSCSYSIQGVQPWALTKFPDFSLTFPRPFCGFPWPWDILSAFHYCLNTNFASNLTNHSPKVAITKWYQLGRLSKYKIWCFKLSQDCAQWQPSELNTLEGQTVLWFLIIFYYLDCIKCKFPDFSLTFPNSHFFSYPSTKFPEFSLTFAKSGISLTFPWPLDTLVLQEKRNSSALAIYLSLFCTNPSIYHSEQKMHDIHFLFWITYINNIHLDIVAIHRWMYKQKYQPIRR